MDRWKAETPRGGIARLMLGMIPATALLVSIQLLWSEQSLAQVTMVVLILAVGGIATVWAYRTSKAKLEVTLHGGVLGIAGRGEHRLAPGSLSCVRAYEHGSRGSVIGTYLVVPLPGANAALLLFSTVLESALYLTDRELTCDAWFGPAGNALLDRLTPFVARAGGADASEPARYAMALRRGPLAGSAAVDAISIVGDRIALGKDGAVVAEARAHEIAFTPFRFARQSDPSGPTFPNAPGLLVEFVKAGLKLTIGAYPMALDDHWKHLIESGAPEYLVGLGELMRLQRVLEAAR